jgi:hypothetical protein
MTEFKPEEWPRIIQLAVFSRKLDELRFGHDDVIALERIVQENPFEGKLVVGTHGLRKLRFARPDEHRGKSGSYRIGYFYYPEFGVIVLGLLWDKSEKANLTTREKNVIAEAAKGFEVALRKGVM